MTQQNNLEAISAFSELRKKSGTVAYLQNLRNKGNDPKSSPEVCPVCRATLENKVSFYDLFILLRSLCLLPKLILTKHFSPVGSFVMWALLLHGLFSRAHEKDTNSLCYL